MPPRSRSKSGKRSGSRVGTLSIAFGLMLVMYVLWTLSSGVNHGGAGSDTADGAELGKRLNALQKLVEQQDKLIQGSVAVQNSLRDRIEKLEGLMNKELAILAARPSQVSEEIYPTNDIADAMLLLWIAGIGCDDTGDQKAAG